VQGPEIIISNERAMLMETGGGLMQAKHLITSDPFLCINSDTLWIDGPSTALNMLAAQWDDAHMDALLLVVPHARAQNSDGRGDFYMDQNGRLARRSPMRVAPFVYAGIQIISKRLLVDAPAGPFSTNLFWDRSLKAGRCYGVVHQGLWFEVGTPQAIIRTETLLTNG
jgi:N-acetyl-alpha-D-muramate 1-phosphate uridylyltransferase